MTVSSTTSIVNNQTVATLTFTGPGITNNSLEDGRYTLTVLANKVSDSLSQNLPSDFTFNFFRLFGDLAGAGYVDNSDAYLLRTTYGLTAGQPGYIAALDYDGDGKVDANDLAQFRLRYGMTI